VFLRPYVNHGVLLLCTLSFDGVDLLSQTTLTVRYTVAIRQAPHPRLSLCVAKTQIRWLLACDFNSLYYVQPHALRPLKYSFGARHDINSINSRARRQDCAIRITLVRLIIGQRFNRHKHIF